MTDSTLDAVLADPDDLAARQAHAAALQAAGDPRGAWIALCCQPDDEGEMLRRALWQHHGDAWMRADVGFAPSQQGAGTAVIYRQGLVDEVSLPLAELLRRADLLARQPIRTLRVHALDPSLTALAAHPLLRTVTTLELGHGLEHLDAAAVTALLRSPHLDRLTELVFSPHQPAGAVLPSLASCQRLGSLRALSLASTPLTADQGRWLGQHLPALERLDAGGSLTAASIEALLGHAAFRLQSLRLGDTGAASGAPLLGEAAIAHALASPALDGLTALSLFGCNLREEGARALAAMACAPRLTSLNLGSQQHPAAVHALADVELPELRRLSVRHNNLGPDDLAAIHRHRHLEALRAEKNRLSAGAVQALAAHLPRLRELDLGDNRDLGNDGASAIVHSGLAPVLRRLRLDSTGLGFAGAAAIAGSRDLHALRELGVAVNPLTRPGVRRLVDAPFDRMERLHFAYASGAVDAAAIADTWVPVHDTFRTTSVFERRLDPDGRPTAAPRRTAPRAKAVPPPARPFDPAGTFALGDRITHPVHGEGVVKGVHWVQLEVRFKPAGKVFLALTPARALPYRPTHRFAVGDIIDHPEHGCGYVWAAQPDGIDVSFGARDRRRFVHGQAE